MKTTEEIISTNLKRLRRQKGWSQFKLAEVSGVGRRAIQEIEAAEVFPRGNTLEALAEAFGVTVSALTTEYGQTPTTPDLTAFHQMLDLGMITVKPLRDAFERITRRLEKEAENPWLFRMGQVLESLPLSTHSLVEKVLESIKAGSWKSKAISVVVDADDEQKTEVLNCLHLAIDGSSHKIQKKAKSNSTHRFK